MTNKSDSYVANLSLKICISISKEFEIILSYMRKSTIIFKNLMNCNGYKC